MRDFLNAILEFIVTESLSDDEFETCTSVTPIYDQNTYNDLERVLIARSATSTLRDRLVSYYEARGVTVSQGLIATSNIYVGSVLE